MIKSSTPWIDNNKSNFDVPKKINTNEFIPGIIQGRKSALTASSIKQYDSNQFNLPKT